MAKPRTKENRKGYNIPTVKNFYGYTTVGIKVKTLERIKTYKIIYDTKNLDELVNKSLDSLHKYRFDLSINQDNAKRIEIIKEANGLKSINDVLSLLLKEYDSKEKFVHEKAKVVEG